MKKDRLRLWERLSALLLAIVVFVTGYMAGQTMAAYPYWQSENWQQLQEFEKLTYQQLDLVMSLVNHCLELHDGDGKLSYLERRQMEDFVKRQKAELDETNTAFRFQIRSMDGQTIYYRNFQEGELEDLVQDVRYTGVTSGSHVPGEGTQEPNYQIFDSWEGVTEFNNVDKATQPKLETAAQVHGTDQLDYVIEYGVAAVPDFIENQRDGFYDLHYKSCRYQEHYEVYLNTTLVLLAISGVMVLLLLVAAGNRAAGADYKPTWLDRVWLEFAILFDLAVAGAAGWGLAYLGTASYVYWNTRGQGLIPWSVGALALLLTGAGTLMLRTVVVRICSHTLLRTTLFSRAALLLRRIVAALPALWRILMMFLILLVSDLMMINMWEHLSIRMIWGLVRLVLLGYLCWWGLSMNKLRKGTSTIAAGNLNHQIDTARMPSDLGELGEDLNNISRGLTEAVDEKMKSERFKAELITNVSHDLKTPLTSIINYVDLLKTTEQNDPRAQEYIKVLERKSQRLKKLTEDLVEASKASTGVLSVHREKIGAGQLLSQALAEWEEKLNDKKLAVVTNMPEGETWIYADGRHLWRVVDNLLSNCCKYAMEGTRIYVDMSRGKGQVSLQVKNVSREPLNIPAERLMERFVRGESSRSSEGSGLGLSIARSLTELQGGLFELEVDGDLFKATVTLPQAN